MQVIDFATKKCLEVGSDFEPKIDIKLQGNNENANLQVKSYGFPDCIGGVRNQSFIKVNFKTFLNEENNLHLEDLRLLKNHSRFCLDQIYNEVCKLKKILNACVAYNEIH